jgi:hypothetical protein
MGIAVYDIVCDIGIEQIRISHRPVRIVIQIYLDQVAFLDTNRLQVVVEQMKQQK